MSDEFKNNYPELQFIYDVYDPKYKHPSREDADTMFLKKPETIFYHFSNQFILYFRNSKELPWTGTFEFGTKGENYWTDGIGNLVEFANILYKNQPFFNDLNVFFFLYRRYRPSDCGIDCYGLKKAIEEQRKEVREKAPEIIQDIAFGNTYEKGLLNLILN